MNTVYLSATVSAAFFLEIVAKFLRNITSQLEALERPHRTFRHLGWRADMTQGEAQRLLSHGETLEIEEDAWTAVEARPNYDRDPERRREWERLSLARSLLVSIDTQINQSREWQTALRKLAVETERKHAAQLDLNNVAKLYSTSNEHGLYELDFVTHVSELRSLIEVLSSMNVNPYREVIACS